LVGPSSLIHEESDANIHIHHSAKLKYRNLLGLCCCLHTVDNLKDLECIKYLYFYIAAIHNIVAFLYKKYCDMKY